MINVDDVRDFDAMLKRRVSLYQGKLRDWLAPHRLRFEQARVHKVLIPMVGVYTPGWQALPAVSWEFVELVTKEGLTGTGEWSLSLSNKARNCLDQLKNNPGQNLLSLDLEEPLFMAWWDLVGNTLNKPLYILWRELFERPVAPPQRVPMGSLHLAAFP